MKENILIGIDFGTKRIGFAVGQTITKTATPLTIIKTLNNNINWKKIEFIINTWNPSKIIGGLPLDFNKKETQITFLALKFFKDLSKRIAIKIEMIEEAFSTREAKWRNKDKSKKSSKKLNLDDVSACIILETWMNKQKIQEK